MNKSAHNLFSTHINEWLRCQQYWQHFQEIIARKRYEMVSVPLVLSFDKAEDIYSDDLYYVRPTKEIKTVSNR